METCPQYEAGHYDNVWNEFKNKGAHIISSRDVFLGKIIGVFVAIASVVDSPHPSPTVLDTITSEAL